MSTFKIVALLASVALLYVVLYTAILALMRRYEKKGE